jgi:hypothetical protein
MLLKKLNNFRTIRRREGSKTGDGRQARINIAGTLHRSLLPAYDPTRGVMTVQSNG